MGAFGHSQGLGPSEIIKEKTIKMGEINSSLLTVSLRRSSLYVFIIVYFLL